LLDSQLQVLWDIIWRLNAPKGLPQPIVRRSTTEDTQRIGEEEIISKARKARAEADKALIEAGFKPSDEYVKDNYGEHWNWVGIPTPIQGQGIGVSGQGQLENQSPQEVEQLSEQIYLGEKAGGFAGASLTYPVASVDTLIRSWNLAKYAQDSDSIRKNIISIALRFSIPITDEIRNSPLLAMTHDYAGAGRFVTWNDLKIGVEYEVGSTRFDRKMKVAYGYITNHVGEDKEALDVYIGPHFSSQKIFKISQLTQDGKELDEYKFAILFETAEQAENAYKRQMPARFFGGIEEVSFDDISQYDRRKNQEKKGVQFARTPKMLKQYVPMLQGKSLVELSEMTNVQLQVLQVCYRRGFTDSDHTNGMARVYQFILGGEARYGEDSDLWKIHQTQVAA